MKILKLIHMWLEERDEQPWASIRYSAAGGPCPCLTIEVDLPPDPRNDEKIYVDIYDDGDGDVEAFSLIGFLVLRVEDPKFFNKLRDFVGESLAPPFHIPPFHQ